MPIQIRELHIKVVVNAAESPPSSTSANDQPAQQPGGGNADADKELIISECVEQVMNILREKTEK